MISIALVVVFSLVASVHAENFYSLDMQAGDIISCHLNGFLGWFGAKHWMLATGPDTVMNAVAVEDKKGTAINAWIREQHRAAVGGCNKDSCQNWGKNYSPRTREEAVANAMSYKDDVFYYDKSGCNCQHWVNKWTKGEGGYSTSSAWWAMPYCKAY